MPDRVKDGASLFDKVFWYFDVKHPAFTFPSALLRQYSALGRRAMFLGGVLGALLNRGPKERKFVFVGTKFKSLILGLPRRELVVVGGVRQGLFSLFHWRRFYFHSLLCKQLADAYTKHDYALLQRTRDELICTLSRYSPKYIVVASDSLPMERLWIDAARSLSVRTICIQHGLFSPSNSAINDGKFADDMFVFDKHQRNIIGLSCLGRLRVLGYHSDVERCQSSKRVSPKPSVCILGQPWAQYYKEKEQEYLGTIDKITKLLDEHKISFVYKPHPSERGAVYLDWPMLSGRLFTGGLSAAFGKHECFISLTSTALLEATLYGKTSFQLFDEKFGGERYEDYGYARTIALSNLEALPRMILSGVPPLIGVEHMVSESVTNRFLLALETDK